MSPTASVSAAIAAAFLTLACAATASLGPAPPVWKWSSDLAHEAHSMATRFLSPSDSYSPHLAAVLPFGTTLLVTIPDGFDGASAARRHGSRAAGKHPGARRPHRARASSR